MGRNFKHILRWQSKKKQFPSLDQSKVSDLYYSKGNPVTAFEFYELELGAEQELGTEWSWEQEQELGLYPPIQERYWSI